MFCGLLKLPQEDVSVAEVAVSSALSAAVTELLGNLQSLLVIVNSFGKVSKQIVNISQVSTGSPLGSSILQSKIELVTVSKRKLGSHLNLNHESHIFFIILHAFLKQSLHLFGKLSGVLMPQSSNVFACAEKLCKKERILCE